MPDTYIEVGPMAFSKDPTKVAAKYAASAKKVMRDAAIDAIRKAPGFTPDKVGNPSGYYFDATLTEITFGTYQGQPSVTCKLNGSVSTYPQMQLLTQKLTGKATLGGGTTESDITDCIKAAMKAMVVERVIPFLQNPTKP